jgi:hypothetical protein
MLFTTSVKTITEHSTKVLTHNVPVLFLEHTASTTCGSNRSGSEETLQKCYANVDEYVIQITHK